ncbi:hypothetical protein, partial [Enterobacter intestinihominis]
PPPPPPPPRRFFFLYGKNVFKQWCVVVGLLFFLYLRGAFGYKYKIKVWFGILKKIAGGWVVFMKNSEN